MINLEEYEKKIYSQNSEDGVLMKLVDIIYDSDDNCKYYVEFGVESGVECNTRILREKYNWNGLLMDGSNENIEINLKKHFITKDNIVNLFQKYNVPNHVNLLSIDLDFNDFYCLKELLNFYRFDIIICEYNASHSYTEDKIVIYGEHNMWDNF